MARSTSKAPPRRSAARRDVMPPPLANRPRSKAAPAPAPESGKKAAANISTDPRLVKLVNQHCQMVSQAKELWDQADVVLASILELVGPEKVIKLDQSRVAVIVDQFEKSNTIWRSHCARRYVISIFGGGKPAAPGAAPAREP